MGVKFVIPNIIIQAVFPTSLFFNPAYLHCLGAFRRGYLPAVSKPPRFSYHPGIRLDRAHKGRLSYLPYITQNTRETLSYIWHFSNRLEGKNHIAHHLQFAYVINVSQCLFRQQEIMHSPRHFYIVCRQHVLRQVLLKKHFFE